MFPLVYKNVFRMSRTIKEPKIGQVQNLKLEEFDQAVALAQVWQKQFHLARSPIKGIIHKVASEKPQVPTIPQMDFMFASILPRMGKSECFKVISLLMRLITLLVCRKELAGHFLQQAAQYMVLNVDAIKLESVWEHLRAAATAAGPNTNLYTEIIESINDMKSDAEMRTLTAHKAWIMVSCLCAREHGHRGISNPKFIQ